MKIIIFAGGTGSAQLQKGLYDVFGKNVTYTIITNCFDAGLSTGTCRTVFGGEILGPSDLRKNQLLRHKLMHGNNDLLAFLESRVTRPREQMQKFIMDNIKKVMFNNKYRDYIEDAVTEFFDQPISHEIEYIDFSVANIIYSGLAGCYNNSMVKAGNLMAKVLDIPEDAVLCSSDESLYLHAITQSGHTIHDEGDIVQWCNAEDKIESVFFTDFYGKRQTPSLTPECSKAIETADLIIFSSGTQWSSLIPTYVHNWFKSAIFSSKAKKYLVLNTTQDKDMYGVDGRELVDILCEYLPMDDLKIIACKNSELYSEEFETYPNAVIGNISNTNKHYADSLVKLIFSDYYKDALECDELCFDYDDTIRARNAKDSDVSSENVKLLKQLQRNKSICTGNTINAILRKDIDLNIHLPIYSERGAIKRENGSISILPMFRFTDSQIEYIYSVLEENEFSISEISNRNNFIVAIKPVNSYRNIIAKYLKLIFPDYMVVCAGKTTIEISLDGLDKSVIVDTWFKDKQITFIGDEYETGNDSGLYNDPRVKFIKVNCVQDTNMLLRILND